MNHRTSDRLERDGLERLQDLALHGNKDMLPLPMLCSGRAPDTGGIDYIYTVLCDAVCIMAYAWNKNAHSHEDPMK